MPWSKHYYTVASPPRRKSAVVGAVAKGDAGAGGAKGDDTIRLSLSLGDIYRNNAPAARTARSDAPAAAAGGGFRRSPVVAPAPALMVPAPVPPAAVHPPPPPLFDARAVEGIGAFFPTSAAPAPPPPPTMAPIDADAVAVVPTPAVPADVITPPPAPTMRRPANRSRSVRRRPIATAAGPNGGGEDSTVEIEGGLHLTPPYPWSTDRVGVHHTLAELSRRGIDTVTGELRCKRCDGVKAVALDARATFDDLRAYVSRNVQGMDDRAPKRWREPALPDCEKCGQRGSMRPVIPADKHRINWVFLLLSETLGVCTLEQLKQFCAHTQQHRTGAKDRVLYSTYMELCNQLLPNGIFDMESERRKRARLNV
ncbi:unnamed protein product [Urochloa humidicola]